ELGARLFLKTQDAVCRQPVDAVQPAVVPAIAHFVHCRNAGLPFETPPALHLQVLGLAEQAYAAAEAVSTRPR
ncbi:MAG: hypothetical protein ABIQ29_06740, partial [Burkholderiaceae bacterium]